MGHFQGKKKKKQGNQKNKKDRKIDWSNLTINIPDIQIQDWILNWVNWWIFLKILALGPSLRPI